MKKVFRVLGFLVLFIAIVAGGGYSYLQVAYPKIDPAPELTIESSPERLARGEYLAHHVTLCMDCHSDRDFGLFSGPPKPGTEGVGGFHFDKRAGFPGDVVSRNITPFALKDWTDGELYRAITSGVSKDGTPLFPIMPYMQYGKMDQEDIYSIIAYVRSLKPVESNPEATVLDFPLNLVVRTMPIPPNHQAKPAKTDQLAYGAYMINAAGCDHCHTKQEKGKIVGEPFAGGFEIQLGNGRLLRSANITPHATGILAMTEEDFLNRFRVYRDSFVPNPVGPEEYQTIMPWMMYAGMEDDDLKAIYAYLRTVPAVDNKVTKFEIVAEK